MIKVLEVPLSEDLTEFAEFLWVREIPHRIIETVDAQAVWIPAQINPQGVRYLYEQWKAGADLYSLRVATPHQQRLNPLEFPLTTGLLVLAVVITLLINFGENATVMRWLTITDFRLSSQHLIFSHLPETLYSLEWWRFFTPVFMHFNWPHLLFNALWIWGVGRWIERNHGRQVYLGLLLGAGIVSNIAQFLVSGPMFGGLSGIVFAVLAYTWLWDKVKGEADFGFPSAIMGFMLVWLMLGYTGALEWLRLGAVANTAHLFGMLAGLVAVPVVRRFFRPSLR